MDVIVTAMKQHASVAAVQEHGCGALRNLAVNAENKVTIARQGGVDVILTAMKQHASVAAVQQYGCGALGNLAGNAENEVPAAEVEAEDSRGKTLLFSMDLV